MDPIQRQLLEQLIAMYAMKDDGTRNPNGVQDVNQMLLDPMTAILGGSAGLDPAAFMPKVEYKDIDLDIPDEPVGRQMLDTYLQSADGSPQSLLAKYIDDGVMPEQAIKELAATFELDEDGVKALQGLGGTFLKEKLDFTQAETDYTRKMEALPRDEQGNIMRQERIETPSELAEQFSAAGLSRPDEQFDASHFTDTAGPNAEYARTIDALKQATGAGGSLTRMQEKLDGLVGQKQRPYMSADQTMASMAERPAFEPNTAPPPLGDPTDRGTAIQRALAEQGTSSLQNFPEGSLEALMQQSQVNMAPPAAAPSPDLLGASSAARHSSRSAGRLQRTAEGGPGVSPGTSRSTSAPRGAGRNERRNDNYDEQIKQASSALKRERKRYDDQASKQLRKTDGARGAAAAMRFHGQTPLSRQLLARLVSAQG